MSDHRPQLLLLRFFRVQELQAREQRRSRPDWLRLMRLKRLVLVLRQELEALGSPPVLQPVPLRIRVR